MSSEKPLLVVLGATGNQGGSVLSHFLSLSSAPYALRGLTRDPSSPQSVSLASRGVEMVKADFDVPSSLDDAFKGASAIFSVTDFWHSFANPALREKAAATGERIGPVARAHEAQQCRNIIDAAARLGSSLERFVFSALPDAGGLSGGKYPHVYHFDGKAYGEEYGRSMYPELWERTNVLIAGFYLENFFGPRGGPIRPVLNESKDTLVLSLAAPLATTPLPLYSATTDTGPLVHALLRASPGKRVIGVSEWLSLRDFAETLGKVLGKAVEFVDENPSFEMGDPDLEREEADMLGFMVEFGYDGHKVDKSIVQPADLGVEVGLPSVSEWCTKQKQDWEKVL
ncbi:related to nitrogen metabolic regulation protein nmr [Cephalotrichum gorgonifer]|uniref:Related to nitrogen metabolic regulation protein nmr n=1 Tax=Cephalotrichum gorgonifer TaxID=2041049 RepID=A0AAE8SZ63_9PEZI|nr:related to nitrogen metabolic regulation protein nmr [Cephalotrichum gorgonifer]